MVAVRILQGISVGAEFASSTTMLVEYAPRDRKMSVGSYLMSSQGLAVAAAALAGYMLSTFLSAQAIEAGGWRLPFLVGAVITPVGYHIRRRIAESPEFEMHADRGTVSRSLFADLRSVGRHAVLRSVGLIIPATVSNSVWFAFLPGFVTSLLKLPFTYVMLNTLISGLALFVLIPVFGLLADRIDGMKVWLAGAAGFSLLVYPLLRLVVAEPSFQRLIAVQIPCAVMIAAMGLQARLCSRPHFRRPSVPQGYR